jgi:hypothetical protein
MPKLVGPRKRFGELPAYRKTAALSWMVMLLLAASAQGQSTGSIRGKIVDPSERRVEGAQLILANPVTGFQRETISDANGSFAFSNLPLQTYSLVITHPGFATVDELVTVRSNVPVEQTWKLELDLLSDSVDVRAFGFERIIDREETGTRTELSLAKIERMPMQVGNRGVEAILLSFPGFAANANGAIHPRGAHNQMTYVVDGMPISDQLSGSFASALDSSTVETIELFTGNVPPEFGSKVSGVASITTKSGLGSNRHFSGSTELGASSFDTASSVTQFAGGTDRFGYFASVNLFKSNRFLDQVSLDNLHNGGNAGRVFTRLDFQPTATDQLRLNLMGGRSSFQLANLRSQHQAGRDQRRDLRDLSLSLGWVRTLTPTATIDSTFSFRRSTAELYPSAGDTPVTAAENRRLDTFNFANRASWLRGRHTLRTGLDYQRFPVRESFRFAITDPDFNSPHAEDFNPNLLLHDLTRGGAPFHFFAERSGNLLSGWIHDRVRLGSWTLSLGLRYDKYRFLVRGVQAQPRVGLAYHLAPTGTVFRVSYNRNYQTPPNENLLLASSREGARLAPPAVRDTFGDGVIQIRPERQNVYEAGIQQALGRFVSLNAVYYHKQSTDLQDNDDFLNTGIIFPTSLFRSRVNGVELRTDLLPIRNLSGSLSLTHGRAVVTPPFTGGLFLGNDAVDALSSGPFIIDHDQALSVHSILNYRITPALWTGWSIRHDSGLVSNPSDPAEVAQDPDYYDLLPFVRLTSNPPRVGPRTLVDAVVGYEHRNGERRLWDVQFQVSNLFDTTALYNFQSIFVGTRLVQPRSVGVKLRRHW